MGRIVFCARDVEPRPWVESLSALLPHFEVVAWRADDPRQADYAVVWEPPPALFETQRRLKGIFNIAAGVDALMRVPNLPSRVPVIRIEDAGMAVQMAEYVCHGVIRFTRRLNEFEADMRAGEWRYRASLARKDVPVGVMGLGVIGARVAQGLVSFDYSVLGWSRTAHVLPGVRTFCAAGGLDAFLRETRVLVCVLPLTPETTGILNRANLEKLLPDGYLINVGRGAHLVDQDLIELLHQGKLAGATLDVFREEPLPKRHPFWSHPKIVMTPHIAAHATREETLAQIAAKIQRMERREPITGIVDRDSGY